MKKIIIILLLLLLVSTPSYAERKFTRIEGRALKYALPLYSGTPSPQYTYKSLGHIENTENWNFQSGAYVMSAALEGLANKAKDMGANAVIKIKHHAGNRMDYTYEGEAVIFDELPEKPYK